MGRQNKNDKIDQFINDFNRSVYHPILNRDIGAPNLNKQTLFFLLLPMLNGEKWTSATHKAAIAVGAVYKAFDAHDEVNVYEDVTTTDQQLKVLSGDFLSGIYYQIMSTTTNFEFIHTMSTTIGRINEVKTEFHANPTMDQDVYLKTIQEIQAECTIQFLCSFGYEKYGPLAEIGLTLVFLMQEKEKGRLNDWGYHHQNSEEIVRQLANQMENELKQATFLTPHLEREIQEMTMPLLGKMI